VSWGGVSRGLTYHHHHHAPSPIKPQRAGRVGRVVPGTVFRLYSQPLPPPLFALYSLTPRVNPPNETTEGWPCGPCGARHRVPSLLAAGGREHGGRRRARDEALQPRGARAPGSLLRHEPQRRQREPRLFNILLLSLSPLCITVVLLILLRI